MPSPKQTRTMQASTVTALSDKIEAAHEATNELMRVQFEAVNEKVDSVITAVAGVKADLRAEDAAIKRDVTENRILADERHTEIVKKVYWGAGLLAAIELIVQFWPKK